MTSQALFPAFVALLTFAFAFIVAGQFTQRHRPHQLVWTVSLALGCIAALSFTLFLALGRAELLFRLYYIAGALLMAAYLGLGSAYLLAPRRSAHLIAAGVTLLGLIGSILLLFAPLNTAILRGPNVEAGSQAIGGPGIAFVVILNIFGALAVVGGAVYSGWRLFRGKGPVHLLLANALIATGTILASLAGTLARVTGNGGSFWVLLAAGFVVLFAGFLIASRRRSLPSTEGQPKQGRATLPLENS